MYEKNGEKFGSIQAIRNSMPNVSLPLFITDSLLEELGFKKVG